MKLSNNFYLIEFTKSQVAERLNIDNSVTHEHKHNIEKLVTKLLQPLRYKLNNVITISSGYRSDKLNTAIGGSSRSQHCKGEAADIECFAISNYNLAKTISEEYSFDQLILEFYDERDPHSGWVHVSYVSEEENRNQILIARKNSRGRVYYQEVRSL